jgi:metallo-beta-lactamase class B
MANVIRACRLGLAAALISIAFLTQAGAQPPPANDGPSLSDISKAMRWEDPEEPVQVVGPIYFVGTEGLGVFLITSSEGHVLWNTGMPSSAEMIEASIRKLGFRPEDIKIMINGHAHIDHAGAFEHFREKYGAKLAVMDQDVAAMEAGDKDDFQYGDELAYPPAEVDRVLRDGDTVKMGDVLLTARHTPGHTRGSTTWVANVVADGKAYTVVFADGFGFNPGYRLVENPSYPGIGNDFRRTHHLLEMLEPDIWLAPHNDYYGLAEKCLATAKEGAAAWVDPEGYRRFIATEKRQFEDQVDVEMKGGG